MVEHGAFTTQNHSMCIKVCVCLANDNHKQNKARIKHAMKLLQ